MGAKAEAVQQQNTIRDKTGVMRVIGRFFSLELKLTAARVRELLSANCAASAKDANHVPKVTYQGSEWERPKVVRWEVLNCGYEPISFDQISLQRRGSPRGMRISVRNDRLCGGSGLPTGPACAKAQVCVFAVKEI